MKLLAAAIVAACCAAALAGCQPAVQDDDYRLFTDESPAVRLRAIHRSGETRDDKAVPYLVDRLTDTDKVVRFYAILSLEKITGTRNGYEYYADAPARDPAVERWRQWLRERSGEPAPTPQEAANGPSSQ